MALVRDAAYRFNERGANSLPLADSTIVYQHAALGLSGGRVRPLQSGDRFAGFAGRRVDNRALAAGAPAVNVPIIASGSVDLLVPGVAATDAGSTVYASDDNTFGLSGLRAVGSISSVVGTDVARVEFDALGAASSVSGDGLTYPESAALPAGAISEWLFSEGGGNTVYDQIAANHISLAAAPTPNAEWTTGGVKTTAGMVQTPSLANVRTVALLYRIVRNEAGAFILSGGPSNGHGLLQDTAYNGTGWVYHVAANGRSVTDLRVAPPGSTRDRGWQLNRGGWVLVFQEFPQQYTTVIGLGGRWGLTTSRCSVFEVAYCAAFSGQLSAAERDAVYQRARHAVRDRGVVIHHADATTKRDALIIIGDSNADGRAVNATMTAAQQALSYARTYILAANSTTRVTPPAALLQLGANNGAGTSTLFGPEIGLAMLNEVDRLGSGLVICKSAQGSTFAAPPGVGSVTATLSWMPTVTPLASSLFHKALAADWADTVQSQANAGIGFDRIGAVILLGTNCATSTATAAVYLQSMQAIISALRYEMGDPIMPIVLVRVRADIPTGNAQAMTDIRAAQATLAASDSRIALVECDRLTMGADGVHYDAAGMVPLGYAVWRARQAAEQV